MLSQFFLGTAKFGTVIFYINFGTVEKISKILERHFFTQNFTEGRRCKTKKINKNII